MAAWNIVLGNFKKPDNPEQQHEDGEAVFRVAKAERGTNRRESCDALQANGSPGDGPKIDW